MAQEFISLMERKTLLRQAQSYCVGLSRYSGHAPWCVTIVHRGLVTEVTSVTKSRRAGWNTSERVSLHFSGYISRLGSHTVDAHTGFLAMSLTSLPAQRLHYFLSSDCLFPCTMEATSFCRKHCFYILPLLGLGDWAMHSSSQLTGLVMQSEAWAAILGVRRTPERIRPAGAARAAN